MNEHMNKQMMLYAVRLTYLDPGQSSESTAYFVDKDEAYKYAYRNVDSQDESIVSCCVYAYVYEEDEKIYVPRGYENIEPRIPMDL